MRSELRRGARLAGALAAALTLAACSDPEPPPPTVESEVQLQVFDCGRILLPTIVDFGLEDSATDVRELFVPCYLIRHPDGDLLWDAGLPPVYVTDGRWIDDGSGAEHRLDAPISEQLATVGLTPADIEYVAFSHFHYDHVGDANAFAGSELFVQQAEYDAAFGEAIGVTFFVKAFYGELEDGPKRILDGEHDVFGDGTVRIVPAPGHTPGHQVLLVELAETGKVLLSGDLWHFLVSRNVRAVPGFNTDVGETLASMEKIETLLQEEDAALWLQHSLEFHETLDWAPAAYR